MAVIKADIDRTEKFYDATIEKVEQLPDGQFMVHHTDSMMTILELSKRPEPGMKIRFYGCNNAWGPYRGIALDDELQWYRTKDEDRDHRDRIMYGKDCAEWLQRWDAGKTIWIAEMGGLGPGYEMAIVGYVTEIVRDCLADTSESWRSDFRKACDTTLARVDQHLSGLSGAQAGVACSYAWLMLNEGPVNAIRQVEKVKGRLIQVSRHWPVVPLPVSDTVSE